MAEALQNVLAMFLIMLAAYVLMQRRPFPVAAVNNLVFHFFLPVTTFYAIARLPAIPAGELVLLTTAGFVVSLGLYGLSLLAARLLRLDTPARKTFVLGAAYGNHIFLGVPVCYALLGDAGTVLALFFALGGYFFFYGVGTFVMTGRITPAAIYKNPMIVAMAAGMLCAALAAPVPSLLLHTFSLMNTATFPLAMVVVGGGLKLRFFSDGGNALPTLAASLLKLVVSPLLVWGVGRSVGLSGDPLAVCVLQAAMPTAVLVTIFSVQYEADPVFSNALVSLTTLASMGTIPVLFFLLR
jgi:hypothetical protein